MIERIHFGRREADAFAGELVSLGITGGLRETTERTAELVRQEAPERSGRLKEGVTPHVDVKAMRGEVEVSAIRPAIPARVVEVVLKSGRVKPVKFRAQPAHDYAQDVAEGTGVYGARGQRIVPKRSKRLRFEVGGVTIFASSTEGQVANPYPERAADRLESELPGVFYDGLEKAGF